MMGKGSMKHHPCFYKQALLPNNALSAMIPISQRQTLMQGLMTRPNKPKGLHYLNHIIIDSLHKIITDVHVTAEPYIDRVTRQKEQFGFNIEKVTDDKAYGYAQICHDLNQLDINPYIPGHIYHEDIENALSNLKKPNAKEMAVFRKSAERIIAEAKGFHDMSRARLKRSIQYQRTVFNDSSCSKDKEIGGMDKKESQSSQSTNGYKDKGCEHNRNLKLPIAELPLFWFYNNINKGFVNRL